VDQRVDGEAERWRSKELVGAAVRLFRCTGASLDGLGSTSGRRGCCLCSGLGIGAAVRAVDGEAERAANWSSPALWGTTLGRKKMKLGGSMS
jgi:hypothetical protein